MAHPAERSATVFALFDEVDGVPAGAAQRWRAFAARQWTAADADSVAEDLVDPLGFLADWIDNELGLTGPANDAVREQLRGRLLAKPTPSCAETDERGSDDGQGQFSAQQEAATVAPAPHVDPEPEPELELELELETEPAPGEGSWLSRGPLPLLSAVAADREMATHPPVLKEAAKPAGRPRPPHPEVVAVRAAWCADEGMASDALWDGEPAVPASVAACTYCDFVRGMVDGSLSPAAFDAFARDDMYYLREVMVLFARLERVSGLVGDLLRAQQSKWRGYAPDFRQLAEQLGAVRPLRAAANPGQAIRAYVAWLRECADEGAAAFLVALGPCATGWGVIFGTWHRRVMLAGAAHPFRQWFAPYVPSYARGRRSMEYVVSELLQQRCLPLRRARTINRRSAQCEAAFFLAAACPCREQRPPLGSAMPRSAA